MSSVLKHLTRVQDADTIEHEGEYKRLSGIDSMEKSTRGSSVQKEISEGVLNHLDRVEERGTGYYGRPIVEVYDKNGVNLNNELIRQGAGVARVDDNSTHDQAKRIAQWQFNVAAEDPNSQQAGVLRHLEKIGNEEGPSLQDQLTHHFARQATEKGRDRDGVFGYSTDMMQRSVGKAGEAIGGASGIEWLEEAGRNYAKKQDREIAEGRYQPEIGGTMREAWNRGGFSRAVKRMGEMAMESSVSSIPPLIGGLVSMLSTPLSVPLLAASTLYSGVMGTGETKSMMDEKGVKADGLAVGAGILYGVLERYGLGKVFPRDWGEGKTIAEAIEVAAEASGGKVSAVQLAKEFAGEVSKRTGAEIGVENTQQGVSIGATALAGGKFTGGEILDNFIDTTFATIPTGAAITTPVVAAQMVQKYGESGTPESADSVQHQVEDILNPDTPRDSVFVGKHSDDPIKAATPDGEELPHGLYRITSEFGTLYTRDEGKAKAFNENPTQENIAKILGYDLTKEQVAELAPQEGGAVVVVAYDREGNVQHMETTTQKRAEGVQKKYDEQGYFDVAITTPEEGLAIRAANRAKSQGGIMGNHPPDKRKRTPTGVSNPSVGGYGTLTSTVSRVGRDKPRGNSSGKTPNRLDSLMKQIDWQSMDTVTSSLEGMLSSGELELDDIKALGIRNREVKERIRNKYGEQAVQGKFGVRIDKEYRLLQSAYRALAQSGVQSKGKPLPKDAQNERVKREDSGSEAGSERVSGVGARDNGDTRERPTSVHTGGAGVGVGQTTVSDRRSDDAGSDRGTEGESDVPGVVRGELSDSGGKSRGLIRREYPDAFVSRGPRKGRLKALSGIKHKQTLIDIAGDMGLDTSGTKKALYDRIKEAANNGSQNRSEQQVQSVGSPADDERGAGESGSVDESGGARSDAQADTQGGRGEVEGGRGTGGGSERELGSQTSGSHGSSTEQNVWDLSDKDESDKRKFRRIVGIINNQVLKENLNEQFPLRNGPLPENYQTPEIELSSGDRIFLTILLQGMDPDTAIQKIKAKIRRDWESETDSIYTEDDLTTVSTDEVTESTSDDDLHEDGDAGGSELTELTLNGDLREEGADGNDSATQPVRIWDAESKEYKDEVSSESEKPLREPNTAMRNRLEAVKQAEPQFDFWWEHEVTESGRHRYRLMSRPISADSGAQRTSKGVPLGVAALDAYERGKKSGDGNKSSAMKMRDIKSGEHVYVSIFNIIHLGFEANPGMHDAKGREGQDVKTLDALMEGLGILQERGLAQFDLNMKSNLSDADKKYVNNHLWDIAGAIKGSLKDWGKFKKLDDVQIKAMTFGDLKKVMWSLGRDRPSNLFTVGKEAHETGTVRLEDIENGTFEELLSDEMMLDIIASEFDGVTGSELASELATLVDDTIQKFNDKGQSTEEMSHEAEQAEKNKDRYKDEHGEQLRYGGSKVALSKHTDRLTKIDRAAFQSVFKGRYRGYRAITGKARELLYGALSAAKLRGMPLKLLNHLPMGIAQAKGTGKAGGSYNEVAGAIVIADMLEVEPLRTRTRILHELGHLLQRKTGPIDQLEREFLAASLYKLHHHLRDAKNQDWVDVGGEIAHPFTFEQDGVFWVQTDKKTGAIKIKLGKEQWFDNELTAQLHVAYHLVPEVVLDKYPAIGEYVNERYARILGGDRGRDTGSGRGLQTDAEGITLDAPEEPRSVRPVRSGTTRHGRVETSTSGGGASATSTGHTGGLDSPRQKALTLKIKQALKGKIDPIWDGAAKLFYTLPWQMEHFKIPGANRIIREFSHDVRTKVKRSLSGKTTTFQHALTQRMGEFQTAFVKIFENAGNNTEIAELEQKVFDELVSGNLTLPESKKMRALFDEMFDHIKQSQRKMGMKEKDTIQKRDNYVPHMWDDLAVKENKRALFRLLDKYVPGMNSHRKERIFEQLSKRGGESLFSDKDELSSLPMSVKRDLNRVLDIPTQELVDAGLIHTKLDYVLNEYNHSVMKGLEWNERFGGYDGEGNWNSSIRIHRHKESMKNLGATPAQMKRFDNALLAVEGRLGLDMNDAFYKTQGWALTLTNWLILPLALTAQLPDLAGPMLRGDAGLIDTWKGMRDAFRAMRDDPKGLQEVAEWWGVITEHNVKHAIQEQYEHGFMYHKAQHWNDKLFRYNGMQSFTRFSRLMAMAMGEQSILKWADVNDTANLESLGLTKQDVDQWVAEGKPKSRPSDANETQQKIMDALHLFTNESIMRPDATQRPIWASDPKYMLLWHLKQFMYSFTKVILKQVAKESFRHAKNGNFARAIRPMAAVSTTIPLAMVGLMLRDALKYVGSDDEPPERELGDWITRSGLLGVGDIFFSMRDRYSWSKEDDTFTGTTLAGISPPFSVLRDVYNSERFTTQIGKTTPGLASFRGYRDWLDDFND